MSNKHFQHAISSLTLDGWIEEWHREALSARIRPRKEYCKVNFQEGYFRLRIFRKGIGVPIYPINGQGIWGRFWRIKRWICWYLMPFFGEKSFQVSHLNERESTLYFWKGRRLGGFFVIEDDGYTKDQPLIPRGYNLLKEAI